MSDSALGPSERGVSRRLVEAVVAFLLMGLSGLVLWDSYGRGAGWEGGQPNGRGVRHLAPTAAGPAGLRPAARLRRPDRLARHLRRLGPIHGLVHGDARRAPPLDHRARQPTRAL